MKVKQYLMLQALLSERPVPSDMAQDETVYHSESGQELIKLLDMQVIHVIRAFKKQLTVGRADSIEKFFDLAYNLNQKRRN